jgi:hypothetical protein
MALVPQPPDPPDLTPLFLLVDGEGKIVQACQLREAAERALDMRTRLLRQTLTLKEGTAQELPPRRQNARRVAAAATVVKKP